MSFEAKFRVVNVPWIKHPFNCGSSSSTLLKAVSNATFNFGAEVFLIVDHLASIGKLYVPSAKEASSKNAALIFSSSGSSPCLISVWRRF